MIFKLIVLILLLSTCIISVLIRRFLSIICFLLNPFVSYSVQLLFQFFTKVGIFVPFLAFIVHFNITGYISGIYSP